MCMKDKKHDRDQVLTGFYTTMSMLACNQSPCCAWTFIISPIIADWWHHLNAPPFCCDAVLLWLIWQGVIGDELHFQYFGESDRNMFVCIGVLTNCELSFSCILLFAIQPRELWIDVLFNTTWGVGQGSASFRPTIFWQLQSSCIFYSLDMSQAA